MNFYKCISFITYIYIHVLTVTNAFKGDLKLEESGLELISPCSVGLKFYVIINNTSEEDYDVELSPEQCCLKHNFNLDCDSMNIIGHCEDNIPRGTKKKLKLVAPILNPYGRHGYCIISFNSDSRNRRNYMEKKTVKIDFNIQLDNKKQSMELPNYVKNCKNIDEDPLNFCKPVECDTYYNGKKPYYKQKVKRCTEIPICISNFRSELPNAIYNPISNTCRHGRSILDEDIEFIKSLEKPNKKPDLELHKLRVANVSDSKFDNLMEHDEINQLYTYDDLEPKKPLKINNAHGRIFENCRSYIVNNKLTLVILFTVVFIQCCLICALAYYVTNKCDCFRRKNNVRNIFNYKADASLTTPLIFSNTNTETTDYQYLSESSNNIIKKIKCYKSCQKERNNDIKISISDDILSKCLTRRDWIDNKYTKSEAIPGLTAIKTNIEVTKRNHGNQACNINNLEKKGTRFTETTRKFCETKVVFEDEKCKKNQSDKKNNRKEKNIPYTSTEDKNKNEKKCSDTLEKEIRSHSYDCLPTNSDDDNTNSNNNFLFYKNKPINVKQGAISLSSNKGAQACFSNDSIDDFLSERGMMFLSGDDYSKYSFSCPSNQAKPLSSELSNKTSKNNMVRNMLTLLHKRSKHGVSSDPGIASNNNHVDVELLHMSRTSVFSTSNDSECVNEFRKPHDSRTSL